MPVQLKDKIDDANSVAKFLVKNPLVHGVELFGSIARFGADRESDIDLIILVDEDIAESWMHTIENLTSAWDDDTDVYTSARAVRTGLAFEMLNITDLELRSELGIKLDELDLFMFPPYWRHILQELQTRGKHTDHGFMMNVSRNALPFNKLTKSFF